MKEQSQRNLYLTGSLLLAHPALRDPNFCHTIVLLSAHSEEGAMGVVLNRPTGKKLADLDEVFAGGQLASVPVYAGGPVNPEQLILAAWQTSPEQASFKLYFGIDPDKAQELGSEGMEIRAFLGYAGWTDGQLEGELRQHTWVVRPVDGHELRPAKSGHLLWRELLIDTSPEMKLLADEPEDPEMN